MCGLVISRGCRSDAEQVAWEGQNAFSAIKLFWMTWENARPEKRIVTLIMATGVPVLRGDQPRTPSTADLRTNAQPGLANSFRAGIRCVGTLIKKSCRGRPNCERPRVAHTGRRVRHRARNARCERQQGGSDRQARARPRLPPTGIACPPEIRGRAHTTRIPHAR